MYWWHGGFQEPQADVKLEWPLLKRVFSYFIPYWPLALIVLACIVAAAALGLVPAIVTRDLINYLTGQHGQFGFVAFLIGLLVGSSLLRADRGRPVLLQQPDQPEHHVRPAQPALRPRAQAIDRLLHRHQDG